MSENAVIDAGSICLTHKLNIGCGNKKIDGFINVDNNTNCVPDIFVDLDKGLGMFDDNSMNEIRAEHVLEHVGDLMLVLNEMYRVSQDGAIWTVFVPHYSYGFAHPFHKRGFACFTFDAFFGPNSSEKYGDLRLIVKRVRLNYTRTPSTLVQILVFPVNFIANLNKKLCERIWCYWVGGFEEVEYILQVDKNEECQ